MTSRSALIAIIFVGCGQAGVEPPDVTAVPFVVFAQSKLVIDRLGVAFPIPVTVGSTASPDTLVSDAPGVVSVGPGGVLTAHRNGTATIRTADGHGELSVKVHAASAIRIEPADVPLRIGDRVNLRLLAEDGSELTPKAASWYTDAPTTILVLDGVVEALAVGSTRVTARYGGLTTIAWLRVEQQPDPTLTIRPRAPQITLGERVTFQAGSRLGPPPRVGWEVRDRHIAQQVGPATFVGRSPGRTQVCTSAAAQACTDLVVRK